MSDTTYPPLPVPLVVPVYDNHTHLEMGIGDDRVMKLATRHGLPHPVLMRFVLKLMANLTDPRGGDAMDKVINALSRLAPAA